MQPQVLVLLRALCAFVLACAMAPAVAQLSLVNVTVDSITNKGCFDRIIFFCTKPELTVRVGLRQRDGTVVLCARTTPSANFDNITGPLATCTNVRAQAPFDMVISLADADESQLPTIVIQETGRLSSRPSGDAIATAVGVGEQRFSINGPDADVTLSVSVRPILPAFDANGLALSRGTLDPALGDEVAATTRIVEQGAPAISFAMGARVRFAVVARAGGAVLDLGEAVFQQSMNITWNGRDGNRPLAPGSYFFRATLVQTGQTVESRDFTLAPSPPTLEITSLAGWNSRAGPVPVGYRLARAGAVTARLYGPAAAGMSALPCTSLPAVTAPFQWNTQAGNHTQGVPLVRADGRFLDEGVYCLQLDSGGQRDERSLRVRNGPPLVLGVSPRPAIPALMPGEPVFVEARALDELRRSRPTASITVKASLADGSPVAQTVSRTCANASRCRLDIPPAMVNVPDISLLVFEASAGDLASPGNADPPPRSAATPPRGTSIGPTLGRGYGAISIPMTPDGSGGFRNYDRRRAIDVALHAGTGFDLAAPPLRAHFVDTVDFMMRLALGEDDTIGTTTLADAGDTLAFWFTTRPAEISVYADKGEPLCSRDRMTPLPFAEIQAVLHLVDCRDTADWHGATFSARASSAISAARVFWHELHHAAFELADEYADDGSYFQTFTAPNVMASAAECQARGAEPSLCEQIGAREEDACVRAGTRREDCGVRRVPWWRAAPRMDVMINNTQQNTDDRRRANLTVARCRRGEC